MSQAFDVERAACSRVDADHAGPEELDPLQPLLPSILKVLYVQEVVTYFI